ncbi:hypothetical protein OIU78_014876 [Salix suchowensis]|nr:hypothetical protein OIU78_014876 [Salix suchowensis]
MKRVHDRASELGTECFFGKEETGRREKNWFAVTSWNIGTQCGKDKKYELCAEFLRLLSGFYGLVDCQEEENSIMPWWLQRIKRKTALTDSEVKQAVELLDRAGKILTSISAGNKLGGDKITTVEPDLYFMHTFNAYDIHGRLENCGPQQQLHFVKSFASSKACDPKHLLQIGVGASQGPRSNPEVATFALNECLSALLSSPSPDYPDVALIVRRLIALASIHKGDSDDNAVHNLYKQAHGIMVGLKRRRVSRRGREMARNDCVEPGSRPSEAGAGRCGTEVDGCWVGACKEGFRDGDLQVMHGGFCNCF